MPIATRGFSRFLLRFFLIKVAATGGTDLEEFLYELDEVGNITKTTELDDTVWDYLYDDRYRLTSAIAKEGTKAKWKETYVYDDGDNLLTKTTPLQENFDDLDMSDWAAPAHYTAENGVTRDITYKVGQAQNLGLTRIALT